MRLTGEALAAVLWLVIVNTTGTSQAAGVYVHAHSSVQFEQVQPGFVASPPSAFQAAPDLLHDHRECMAAIENVGKEVDRLLGPGTRWPFYPDINLWQVQQVQFSLVRLYRQHQGFADEAKDQRGIANNLRKIEKLRSDIDRQMARIISELQYNKSPRWRVDEQMRDIETALTRWRRECRKIGKALQAAHTT